jgi:hypothetical protein
MKKLAILSVLLAWFSICAFSQDRIYLKSGKIERVKVSEIAEKTVRYRLFDNIDGPEYVVEKTRIEKIVYENGTEERFSANVENKPPRHEKREKPERVKLDYGHHFVGFNLADLFRTDVTLHYEYIFNDDRLGLRIPIGIGFNNNHFNTHSRIDNPYVFRRNRVFETGLDFRFYPGGQGHVRYVMGPALHYILHNKRGPLFGSVPVGNHHVNTIRWLLYNGIVFSPTKNFRFGFDVGLGSQYDLTDTKYTDERVFGDPKIQFNWYMGAKF